MEKDGWVLRQSGCMVHLLAQSQHLQKGKKKRTRAYEQRQRRLFRKTQQGDTGHNQRMARNRDGGMNEERRIRTLRNRGTSSAERYQRVALT